MQKEAWQTCSKTKNSTRNVPNVPVPLSINMTDVSCLYLSSKAQLVFFRIAKLWTVSAVKEACCAKRSSDLLKFQCVHIIVLFFQVDICFGLCCPASTDIKASFLAHDNNLCY